MQGSCEKACGSHRGKKKTPLKFVVNLGPVYVDYKEEVYRSRILGGWNNIDWLRNGFFNGRGLYCGQEFSGGELQA